MLTITGGSFLVPLLTAGGFCLLGAFVYMFVMPEVRPLAAREPVRA
jgi:hypothetical protein